MSKKLEKLLDQLVTLHPKYIDLSLKRIKSLRASRNNKQVNRILKAITDASNNSGNLTPLIIEAAKSYATLGEIVDSMKIVFGEWEETAVV